MKRGDRLSRARWCDLAASSASDQPRVPRPRRSAYASAVLSVRVGRAEGEVGGNSPQLVVLIAGVVRHVLGSVVARPDGLSNSLRVDLRVCRVCRQR